MWCTVLCDSKLALTNGRWKIAKSNALTIAEITGVCDMDKIASTHLCSLRQLIESFHH